MTGQFIFFRESELGKKVRIINKAAAPLLSMPGKYTHAVLTFTDGSKLFYNDVRQFGYLKLVAGKDLEHLDELKDFGPEPLDKNFTIRQFLTVVKNARKPKVAIKQLLMDPKFVAGIGNIYSDEILFHAKVRSERRVATIKMGEARKIFKAIKKVLEMGVAAKGSSVGNFIRTDGSWGSMGKHHFAYGRAGLPCKVCGSVIKSAKFNGRTGSFCPKCQK
jgi:formamidopyrimidine-DNA glycosylase